MSEILHTIFTPHFLFTVLRLTTPLILRLCPRWLRAAGIRTLPLRARC